MSGNWGPLSFSEEKKKESAEVVALFHRLEEIKRAPWRSGTLEEFEAWQREETQKVERELQRINDVRKMQKIANSLK